MVRKMMLSFLSSFLGPHKIENYSDLYAAIFCGIYSRQSNLVHRLVVHNLHPETLEICYLEKALQKDIILAKHFKEKMSPFSLSSLKSLMSIFNPHNATLRRSVGGGVYFGVH